MLAPKDVLAVLKSVTRGTRRNPIALLLRNSPQRILQKVNVQEFVVELKLRSPRRFLAGPGVLTVSYAPGQCTDHFAVVGR